MSSHHLLMRPMRGDELKPRPPAQAAWAPAAKTAPAEISAEPRPSDPLPEAPAEEDDALGDILASLLDGSNVSAETPLPIRRESSDKHDAVPNHMIPTPVCVPLYEDPAPARKRRGWIWVLIGLAALAGAALAAWYPGLVPFNLA